MWQINSKQYLEWLKLNVAQVTVAVVASFPSETFCNPNFFATILDCAIPLWVNLKKKKLVENRNFLGIFLEKLLIRSSTLSPNDIT